MNMQRIFTLKMHNDMLQNLNRISEITKLSKTTLTRGAIAILSEKPGFTNELIRNLFIYSHKHIVNFCRKNAGTSSDV